MKRNNFGALCNRPDLVGRFLRAGIIVIVGRGP